MSTHPYFEDPVIVEGLSKLKSLSSSEERKIELKRLRKLVIERHPALEQRMSGSVEEFFSALDSEEQLESSEFIEAVDEMSKSLAESKEEFPVLPKY